MIADLVEDSIRLQKQKRIRQAKDDIDHRVEVCDGCGGDGDGDRVEAW